MMLVTLTGRALEDAESRRDRKNTEYARFKLVCEDRDGSGNTALTIFVCMTYSASCAGIRKGDEITLTGRLSVRRSPDGHEFDFLVMVQNIAIHHN